MAKLPCPPELWPTFSALLDEALDLPESERPRWLAALGDEHAAVRPWLNNVLGTTRGTLDDGFLQTLVMGDAAGAVSDFVCGQQVGPYLLEQRLGRGGMGEVWLASRSDGTLNRQVALKLPHGYLLAGVLRRRFERERDILAALSHPHIAQLYDAGVADSQHPYLAMEWVDGVPINQHCSEAKLTVELRIDLFLQILDAVAYAHARLIAHRDLKPSNILVTRDGSVKLLDFGIAKLINGDTGGGATELTQVGGCAATPDYAAPEQLAGEPITVAVDLYALGVVLYELLAGQRPYQNVRKTGTRIDAPRASSQIHVDHSEEVGGLDTRHLRRALHGDLDAIIAKALEADPTRRYRSAEAFASDLKRSRDHRPISARHVGPLRLTLKFVRRNWLAAAMTASLLLALIGGSAGIAWQAVRAEREAVRATAIKDFLIGMFRASDPRIASDKPRGTITARELLDATSPNIEKQFANDPETEIDLLGVTSQIYNELGETEHYNQQHRRYTELALAHYGPLHPIVIQSLLDDIDDANSRGDHATALHLLDDADVRLRRAGLDRSGLRGTWWYQRSFALMADFSARERRKEALNNAIRIFKAYSPANPDLVVAQAQRGFLSHAQSDFAHAIEYFQQALATARQLSQPDEGELQTIYAGLASSLKLAGQSDKAEAAYQTAISLAYKTYGAHNWRYWNETAQYARMVHVLGNRQQALKMFDELSKVLPNAESGYRDAFEENEATAVRLLLARCLAEEGRAEQAIPLLEAADRRYRTATSFDIDLVRVQSYLGDTYARVGRVEDARQMLALALEEYQRRGLIDDPDMLDIREIWGRFLLTQGEMAGASMQFHSILEQTADAPSTTIAARAYTGLAQIAIAHSEKSAALDFSKQAMEKLANAKDFHNVRIEPYIWRVRAQALLLSGDAASASEWAQRALDADRRYDNPASADIAADQAVLRSVKQVLQAKSSVVATGLERPRE